MLLLGLLVWVALAYLPVLRAGFIFDDNAIIVQNPTIQRLSSLPEIFIQPYWPKNNNEYLYRPLTTFTYAINWLLAGNRPWVFHLVNLLLHLANIFLAWLLLARWGVDRPGRTLIVGLWALHPVLTEDVAAVVGRADLLVFLFLMLFLLTERRSLRILLYSAALLSKENALFFPLLAVVDDLCVGRVKFTEAVKKHLYLLVVPMSFILVKVALLGTFYNPYAVNAYSNPLVDAGLHVRAATMVALIGRYASKILFPFHLAVSYYADSVSIVHLPFRWDFAVGLVIIILITIHGIKRPVTRVYYLLAALSFLPFTHLFMPIGVIMAERFLYIPLLFLLSGLMTALPRRRTFTAVGFLVILALSARTTVRCMDYKSNLTLFKSAVVATPNNAMAHFNYAQALLDEGRLDEAMIHFRRAASITPDDANIYKSMILLTRQRGMVEKSLDTAESFLRLHPDNRDILAVYLALQPPAERRYEVVKKCIDGGKGSLALMKLFLNDAITLGRACEPLTIVKERLKAGLWDDQFLKLSAYASIRCGDDDLAVRSLQMLCDDSMAPDAVQEIILIAMKAGEARAYTILETIQAGLPEHPYFACNLADLARLLHDDVREQYWLGQCLAQPDLPDEQRSYFERMRR